MTDLLLGHEGVNVPTSRIATAVTLPVNLSIADQVRRFGFEYEMLPRSYRDDDRYRGSYCNDCDCDVEDCECECGFDGGRVSDLIGRVHRQRLIATPEQHDYHCGCSTCRYDRAEWLLVAQTDCSVGVEFVSRILDLKRPDWPTVVGQVNDFISVMHQWSYDDCWMPDGDYGAGNHVHVSSQGDNGGWGYTSIDAAAKHIDAIYAVFDWDRVADGGTGQVRGYNSKPDRNSGGYGGWLSKRGQTFEHRLWNTPANPDLLWGHIGLSIAIQRWAFNIALQRPHFNFWTTFNRYGEASMSDAHFNEINIRLGEIITGIRAYIPPTPEFGIAHELITNLRSL